MILGLFGVDLSHLSFYDYVITECNNYLELEMFIVNISSHWELILVVVYEARDHYKLQIGLTKLHFDYESESFLICFKKLKSRD